MSVLWVTGGKGFIARHLARLVAGAGHRVYGIGHGHWSEKTVRSWGVSAWINGEIHASNLSQLAQNHGIPEVIFHLAGGSSVGASLQNPHEDFGRTVDTTARLLEWVRLNAAQCGIVCASSAAVYGAGHIGPISEATPCHPFSPYGAHKAMMEMLCTSYSENFALRTAIVRLFSVYGPGLEKQLIWDLCCKLASADQAPVTLGGTGDEMRDWLHVEDAVQLMYLVSSAASPAGPVFNGGTGLGTPIRAIVEMVCEAWGWKGSVEFGGQARKGDPVSLVAATGLSSRLGFEPQITLFDGIRATVAWFKSRM